MSGWRIFGIVAAFVLVFMFGGVIGGGMVVLLARSRVQEAVRHEREHASMREEIQNEKLTALQSEKAQAEKEGEFWRREAQQAKAVSGGGQGGFAPNGRRAGPDQWGPQLMQRLVNQVKPTPEQRAKIQPMVTETAEELRRLRRDTAHSTEVIVERLEDQISAVLDQAQKDRFNILVERWRQAFQNYNRQQQLRQAQQRMLEQQAKHKQPDAAAAPSSAPQ